MKRTLHPILTVLAMSFAAYAGEEQPLSSMTIDEAVQVVKEALTNRDEGLGMCPVPHFNRDTRTPRFQSADAEKFMYLDNKGGGARTNDCPDPDHQFTVPYLKIKRIFVSKTRPTSGCRYEKGSFEVIQIIGWHGRRNFPPAEHRYSRTATRTSPPIPPP